MKYLLAILFLTGCSTIPAKFQVGDIVEARNFTAHPEYNGTRVVITKPFGWQWIKGPVNTLQVYEVRTVDGEVFAAQDFQLKPLEKGN